MNFYWSYNTFYWLQYKFDIWEHSHSAAYELLSVEFSLKILLKACIELINLTENLENEKVS